VFNNLVGISRYPLILSKGKRSSGSSPLPPRVTIRPRRSKPRHLQLHLYFNLAIPFS